MALEEFDEELAVAIFGVREEPLASRHDANDLPWLHRIEENRSDRWHKEQSYQRRIPNDQSLKQRKRTGVMGEKQNSHGISL